MYIFDDTPKHPDNQKIKRSDIQYMTQQLHKFIHIYESKVAIETDEVHDKINQLKQILSIMELERYDLLLNDPSIIENDCVDLDVLDNPDSFDNLK